MIEEEQNPLNDDEADKPIEDTAKKTVAATADGAEADQTGESEPAMEVEPDPVVFDYSANPNIGNYNPVHESASKTVMQRYSPGERLSLLGGRTEEIKRASESHPSLQLGAGPVEKAWFESVEEASANGLSDRALEGALDRPGSTWDNRPVDQAGLPCTVVKPRFEATDGELLTGDAAIMRMQLVQGNGSVVKFPLWHSGLWLTMRAPTEQALLDLEQTIAMEKVTLGRSTSGLIFSNAGVYHNKHVIDFALRHVVEASIRVENDNRPLSEILLSKIKIPDMNLLVHGLVCSMYPYGFPYEQPCVINPAKCIHKHHDTIAIPRLVFTDTSRLTNAQRNHMARRQSRFTDIELKAYQDAFEERDSRIHIVNDGVRINFRLPTLLEWYELGTSWVDQIVSDAERAFGPDVSPKIREQWIFSRAAVTAACQFNHWVDSLALTTRDPRTQKPVVGKVQGESVTETLAAALSERTERENYFNAVQRFIDDTNISMIAMPKVPCPNCTPPLTEEEAAKPQLNPVDVVSFFFHLKDQRLFKILGTGT